MSVTLMGAVKQRGPREGPLRLTLHTICDEADDFGFAAASIETIAAGSCCSIRQAIRRVALLEKHGWIRVRRKIFRGQMANAYFVNIERLGVAPGAKSRRSPLWTNVERMLKALESRDKVSLRNGVLKFEKTQDSVETAKSGDLFYDADGGVDEDGDEGGGDENEPSGSDTMSLENEPKSVQNTVAVGASRAILAKKVRGGTPEAEEERSGDENGGSAGDIVSHVTCHPCHVTSDIQGQSHLIKDLTRFYPVPDTPLPPVPGELVLPFPDCRFGEAGFALTTGVAARWVMGEAGMVTGLRSTAGLEAIVTVALSAWCRKTARGLEEAARLAVKQHAAYRRDLPLMHMPWGVKRFFSEAHWQDASAWPYDPEKRRRKVDEAAAATGYADAWERAKLLLWGELRRLKAPECDEKQKWYFSGIDTTRLVEREQTDEATVWTIAAADAEHTRAMLARLEHAMERALRHVAGGPVQVVVVDEKQAERGA